MPPGGPEDFESPAILRLRPDTNAVNVRANAITYNFDKVVSERPQGATDLASLFLISPSHGMPRVSWRRNMIAVSPRGGFDPATTYSVRMLPGLTDLQGNVDTVGRALVFSTGPAIATGTLRGIVFDWLAEKVAPQAFIEAFPVPTSRDSTRYLTVADSTGRYELAHVPPGRYLLRASIDQNKNRLLDPRELFDTVTIALTDSVRHEILAFVHDTIGAGIQTVSIVDSLTLRVMMDRALDTTFVIDASHFSLRDSDSSLVGIAQARSRRAYDQAREEALRTKAIEDSVRRAAAADSVEKADTVQAPPAPPPPPSRRAPPPRRDTVAAPAPAGRDTTAQEPPPKPSIPAPIAEIYLTLEQPLRPKTSYRLRAIEMRTLLNRSRTSERVITTPVERKPPPDSAARDTTGAQRDSAARRDTSATRDTTTVRDTMTVRDASTARRVSAVGAVGAARAWRAASTWAAATRTDRRMGDDGNRAPDEQPGATARPLVSIRVAPPDPWRADSGQR